MIWRTHLAVGVGAALYFLPHVTHKYSFIFLVIFATMLPDIDKTDSKIGKHWIFRPFQLFMKHRGVLHTYTFCVVVSIILAFFWPVLALPFFIGYGVHLLLDSFTVEGIQPFWPVKRRTDGMVRSGGKVDNAIFGTVLLFDVLLAIKLFI